MIEIIQAHAKPFGLAIILVLFAAIGLTGCKVSDVPQGVLYRIQNLEGDGSVIVQTVMTGTHSIHYKNARQEDGFFLCDQLDVKGRTFQLHAVNYRRPLVEKPRKRNE